MSELPLDVTNVNSQEAPPPSSNRTNSDAPTGVSNPLSTAEIARSNHYRHPAPTDPTISNADQALRKIHETQDKLRIRRTAPVPTAPEIPPASDSLSEMMPPSHPPLSSLPQSAKIPASRLVTSAPTLPHNLLPANNEDSAALAIPPAVPAGFAPLPGVTQPTPESLAAASDPLKSLPPRRNNPVFTRNPPENVAATSIPNLSSNRSLRSSAGHSVSFSLPTDSLSPAPTEIHESLTASDPAVPPPTDYSLPRPASGPLACSGLLINAANEPPRAFPVRPAAPVAPEACSRQASAARPGDAPPSSLVDPSAPPVRLPARPTSEPLTSAESLVDAANIYPPMAPDAPLAEPLARGSPRPSVPPPLRPVTRCLVP